MDGNDPNFTACWPYSDAALEAAITACLLQHNVTSSTPFCMGWERDGLPAELVNFHCQCCALRAQRRRAQLRLQQATVAAVGLTAAPQQSLRDAPS